MQMFLTRNISIWKILYLALLGLIIIGVPIFASISINNISSPTGPSYGVYVNGVIYYIAQGANSLVILNGTKIVANYSLPFLLGADPFKIAYGNGEFFIVYQKGPVVVWKNNQVIAKYFLPNIGKYPDIIYADGYAIVTESSGNEVAFISSDGHVINVTVMDCPQALAYDNYTNVVYVGAFGSNKIYGISLSNFKVVYNFTINDTTIDTMTFVPPGKIAVATYEQQVELINATSGKVVWAVSMPSTVTGKINGYSQITYANDYLYVSIAHNGDEVAIISKNGTLVDLLTVGTSAPSAPNGIIYDPTNGLIYVLDYQTNQISYFPALSQTTSVKPVSAPSITYYYAVAGGAVLILVIVALVIFLRRRSK